MDDSRLHQKLIRVCIQLHKLMKCHVICVACPKITSERVIGGDITDVGDLCFDQLTIDYRYRVLQPGYKPLTLATQNQSLNSDDPQALDRSHIANLADRALSGDITQ